MAISAKDGRPLVAGKRGSWVVAAVAVGNFYAVQGMSNFAPSIVST